MLLCFNVGLLITLLCVCVCEREIVCLNSPMSSSKLQRLNTWFGWRDRTGYRIRSEVLSTYALVTGWKVEVRGRSRGNSSRRSRKHRAQDQALVVLQLCSLWSQHQTLIHPSIYPPPPQYSFHPPLIPSCYRPWGSAVALPQQSPPPSVCVWGWKKPHESRLHFNKVYYLLGANPQG